MYMGIGNKVTTGQSTVRRQQTGMRGSISSKEMHERNLRLVLLNKVLSDVFIVVLL